MLRRARHDRGASGVEYAILLALVALIALGGMKVLGGAASGSLSDSQAQISGTSSSTTSTTAAPTTTTAAPTTTTTRPTTTTTTRRPSTTTTTRRRGND